MSKKELKHCTQYGLPEGEEFTKDQLRHAEWAALANLLLEFSMLMKVYLSAAQDKGKSGWDSKEEFPSDQCLKKLLKAIEERNWVSVANYAMFMYNREGQPDAE